MPVPWDEGEVVLDEKGSPKRLSESSKRALYSEIEAALRGRDPRTSAELSGTERTYIHPPQGHLGIYLRDSGGSIVNGACLVELLLYGQRLAPLPRGS